MFGRGSPAVSPHLYQPLGSLRQSQGFLKLAYYCSPPGCAVTISRTIKLNPGDTVSLKIKSMLFIVPSKEARKPEAFSFKDNIMRSEILLAKKLTFG